MGFEFLLPEFCRGDGERKWEVAGGQRSQRGLAGWLGGECLWERSGDGETVSVGGFDDETGRDHGDEALIESGAADAARCAQLGEWPSFAAVGESRGLALIHGERLDAAFGLRIGLDGLEGNSVITLGEF
jgi:hypothetical protein